jgi:Tol biopolymer transport system component/catechol 2,3-dioxygenase-like lactoylglutathione lyase family enzyme
MLLRWFAGAALICAAAAAQTLGTFESQGDVGENPKAGSATFDAATGEYKITGGGANMWAQADAFHYVWKRMSGDFAITADVRFIGAGVVAHRKAVLVVRQTLEPGSPYADAALHGDGMTSLQYRLEPNTVTLEKRSDINGPTRIRIERRGNRFTMLVGKPGEPLKAGDPVSVPLTDPVYAGIGVCSHDVSVLETAVFSNVSVERLAPQQAQRRVRSKISVYDLASRSVKVIYTEDKLYEAPNWSPDGKYLLVNSGGALFRLAPDTPNPKPESVNMGSIVGANNDHGITKDGKLYAVSARGPTRQSQVYVMSANGGEEKLLTPKGPSYFHGWSPDGKWLAYTAQRDGDFDVFRISVNGGEEERLNKAKGLDDGPDYSPDGKWIYVNSERTGHMRIWRFPAEGAGPDDSKAEQLTDDEFEDWFPHPSPDGKWMTIISFPKGTQGHPPNLNVQLRLMRAPGKGKPKIVVPETIYPLFGGQGTINVNSWSPDSKRFAFVSYELLPDQTAAAGPARPRITGVPHIAIFAKDYDKSREFYREFLGYQEPFSLKKTDGSPDLTFFKINERQYIELFTEREPGSDRLNHIALEVPDAEAMRQYLKARGVAVPDRVNKGRIGTLNFNIKDPDGHTVEIVQYAADSWPVRDRGKFMDAARVSDHMMHVGILVGSLEASNRFYRDVLGFREIWRGGRNEELSWVNMQVPDGEDYIEFMLYKDLPAPTARGSAHHLCLSTPDIEKSKAALEAKAYRSKYERTLEIRTGINRKRQLNLFDPDGTRSELMEPQTVDGKPAPNSTAPPPRP